MRLILWNVINGVQFFSCLFVTFSRLVARLSWHIAPVSSVSCNYYIFNLEITLHVHKCSLQFVKITFKFPERSLINRSFCRGTFYLVAPCIMCVFGGTLHPTHSMSHFIFRLNLSFKPKLKPKFSLKPKLIWTIQFKTERTPCILDQQLC